MQLPDYSHDYVRSYATSVTTIDFQKANELFAEMEREGEATLRSAGINPEQITFARSIDMRYAGQFHEVDVPVSNAPLHADSVQSLLEAFHARHEERFNFSLPERRSEILYLRVRAIGAVAKPRIKEFQSGGSDEALKGFRSAYFGKTDGWRDTPVYDGAFCLAGWQATGPAIVEEATTTILVPVGFECQVDSFGNFLLTSIK